MNFHLFLGFRKSGTFDFLYIFLYLGFTSPFAESSPRTSGPSTPSGDDWRSAFDAAANGPVDYNSDMSRSGSNGHSRHSSDPAQNGDVGSGSNSSRRTPNRRPPAPPQSGSSGFKLF